MVPFQDVIILFNDLAAAAPEQVHSLCYLMFSANVYTALLRIPAACEKT
jgi:hypothetical protein